MAQKSASHAPLMPDGGSDGPASGGAAAWRATTGGALAGLVCGVLLWGLDLAQLPATDRSPRAALLLAEVILPLALLVGALAGLGWRVLSAVGRRLAARVGRGEPTGVATLITLHAAPGLVWLVARLASGRQASQLLGDGWKKALVVVLLCALVWSGCWVAVRIALAVRRGRGRLLPLGVALALLGAVVALYLADARLYRRLYGYLHALLFVTYAAAALLATIAAWRGLVGNRARAAKTTRPLTRGLVAALLLGGAALGAWHARQTLTRDPQVRFAAMELTTAATKILAVLPRAAANEGPVFLDLPLQRRPSRGRGTYRVDDANVVLVTIDALRADRLGVHGNKRALTPTLDALARRSIRFETTYCPAPLTCYSVPSLHTGDYLHSTLALLPRPPVTLADILGAQGYATAAFYHQNIFFCDDQRATSYGKRSFGFRHAETGHHVAPKLTDQAIGYLQQHRARGGGKLFMWVHYFDVHEPYHRHPEHDFGKRDIDRYDSEVAYTDAALARLVAALGQLKRPTILVVSSDHGEEFREHGGSYHGSSLYEEQIRIPLLVAVPGLKPRVVREPVELVDVAPTVLSLLGLRIPESIRGQSLVPLLLGHRQPERAAHSEVHTKKMVRVGDWKLIHDFRRGTHELYDLAHDPKERRNVYGRRPRQATRLKARLQSWFEKLRSAGSREENRPRGIDLGRIGDRRAVPLLTALVTDPDANPRWRREGARLLGNLQDKGGVEALWRAASGDDRLVAAEAAIALGELKDRRARALLPALIDSTDNDLRLRAAVALARVDSPAATPALLEAVYSQSWELQNRAIHYLAFVGDSRAIPPLIEAAKQTHLRSRAAVALGHLGRRHRDPRVVPFLLGLVQNDHHPDVRHRALAALSFVGDRRVVSKLRRLLDDPDLTWVPEALTRLDALGRAVPGIDFSPARRGLQRGWGRCRTHESWAIARFVGRTWCPATEPVASARFSVYHVPRAPRLMLRLRPLGATAAGSKVTVKINGKVTGKPLTLTRSWKAHRLPIERRLLRRGPNRISFHAHGGVKDDSGWLGVDYVVIASAKKRR